MGFDVTELLTAIHDGAFVIDSLGGVTIANDPAIDLLQLRPVGLPATSVVRSPLFAEAIAAVRTEKIPINVEVEFRGLPPRHVTLQLSKLGNAGDVLVLLRDQTREQAIEKMRSDFVANASHEMRTPLSSIIGGVETLQGAAKNDEKARSAFLETILMQAHRMKRLIDDLLTLSRIELNEHVRPNTTASLTVVARQAKANLSEMSDAARVTVDLKGTELVTVAGDAEELLQAAQNLLENAIKYGNAGGKIEVECFVEGEQGHLAVRDHGKGIADIHLPRLTERFYRVSTQESRSRGGTGLGLAIVKHIVSRHRGKLSVSSKEGQGSTFSVSIPLVKSAT
jgi:two-component system, OmpR family, phosphate regulon sensor histidine kinase PhoR